MEGVVTELTVDMADNVATLIDPETDKPIATGNYTMVSKEGLILFLNSRVYHTTM